MNREIYLASHWLRYPCVDSTIIDCAEALGSSGAVRVGGRLEFATSDWSLASGGARLPVSFSDAVWSREASLAEPPPFHPAVLRPGDLVALAGRSENGVFRAKEVALLFAAEDRSWKHASASGPFHLNWTPSDAKRWAAFTSAVRDFFKVRGFIEARTPTLVRSPGTEPFLEPFVTRTVFGARAEDCYLPTSPEFHLKKLLVAGFTRVFELKDCFRNNEGGGHHQPEFLMLEWYRAFSNLDAIAADCDDLLGAAAEGVGAERPGPLTRTTMSDLFVEHLGFNLGPTTSKEELRRLARAQSVVTGPDDSWDEIFFRLFLTKIEPRLQSGGPWLVKGYPPSQAALARIGSDGWADRFEIYWKGVEIANAFHELNDPDANVERFRKDASERAAQGKPPVPRDEELVSAFYRGLPPSGGIALGMDRLFMALTGVPKIEDTRAFPRRNQDPEK